MTTEVLIKGFWALVFSGMFAWMVLDREFDTDLSSNRPRYLPYIPSLLLPLVVLSIMALAFLLLDTQDAMRNMLTFCFGVFLHICLYYLLLLPALPLLRRYISARACAVLWMLPNFLYVTQMSFMRLPRPRWVIEAPLALLQVLLVVWLAGFVAVMGWKIVSHLLFRARILHDAVPVTDSDVLAVWEREVAFARCRQPKFRLVVSPAVQTPLSVGLFGRAVRVVLPKRAYTPEELTLLFRHELVHIGREDAWNKFFLAFCAAMCWFYPLIWTAIKRSAEDLELSCDETVLLDADEETKRRYAGLLLKTAGEERGFTTCLSASARALRYRLKSVVSQKQKHSGALAVGLVFFLLCMSCGYVTLAYGESTGAKVIYSAQPTERYTLRSIELGKYICTDEDALHCYLSGLRMERIAGNYTFESPEWDARSLSMLFDAPAGVLSVTLSDSFIELARIPLHDDRVTTETFYLPDGVDWQALDACIARAPVSWEQTDGAYARGFAAYCCPKKNRLLRQNCGLRLAAKCGIL